METGAITGYIDVAQLVLYAFWIFFAGLIIYLRREDKREGYPLESERSGSVTVQGFPAVPSPKTFLLRDGHTVQSPRREEPETDIKAKPAAPFPGAPLIPEGDGVGAGVGPGAFANRADEPDQTYDGRARIVPMRSVSEAEVDRRDADPRGMDLVGTDGEVAGTIKDLWLDLSEPHVRYLEAEVGGATGPRRILVPIYFAKIDGGRGRVKVDALKGHQLAHVPGTANPDLVTLLEEDRIMGYFGSGTLYADAMRQEPLI
jgi:photosynthetic reaction center H subunit